MNKVKILILITVISGCTAPKYFIATNTETFNGSPTQKIKQEYSIFSTVEHKENRVIFIPEKLVIDSVIIITINLIKTREYIQLKKYLKSIDDTNLYLPISKGLLKFYMQDYQGAIKEFNKNEINDFQIIANLLIIDCEYEISIISSKTNYNNLLNKYQSILDNYDIDDIYKEIINNRIKFIRYKI